MRVMAIDPGKRRFGIALCDPLGLTVTPLTTLDKKRTKNVVADIVDLVKKEGVEAIVVGLPLEVDGTFGPAAKRSMHFRGKLEAALSEADCPTPIESLNEAFTTTEAYSRLRERGIVGEKAKAVVDEEAAAVILESYLRQKAQGEPGS